MNPAYGLYASFSGKIGGGLSTSTKLMVVTTTTAASLAAGSALADIPAENRDSAVITLTILTGVVMIAVGLLHLGRYIRFVSRSVMLGFLTGVAVNIVFGQLSGLLGSPTEGGVAAQKALYVITHPTGIDMASAIVGVSALAVMFLLEPHQVGAVRDVDRGRRADRRRRADGVDRRGDGGRRRGDPERAAAAGAAATCRT